MNKGGKGRKKDVKKDGKNTERGWKKVWTGVEGRQVEKNVQIGWKKDGKSVQKLIEKGVEQEWRKDGKRVWNACGKMVGKTWEGCGGRGGMRVGKR